MKKKSLPTIWEVTDQLWKRMALLILEMFHRKKRVNHVPTHATSWMRSSFASGRVVNGITFRRFMETIPH